MCPPRSPQLPVARPVISATSGPSAVPLAETMGVTTMGRGHRVLGLERGRGADTPLLTVAAMDRPAVAALLVQPAELLLEPTRGHHVAVVSRSARNPGRFGEARSRRQRPGSRPPPRPRRLSPPEGSARRAGLRACSPPGRALRGSLRPGRVRGRALAGRGRRARCSPKGHRDPRSAARPGRAGARRPGRQSRAPPRRQAAGALPAARAPRPRPGAGGERAGSVRAGRRHRRAAIPATLPVLTRRNSRRVRAGPPGRRVAPRARPCACRRG